MLKRPTVFWVFGRSPFPRCACLWSQKSYLAIAAAGLRPCRVIGRPADDHLICSVVTTTLQLDGELLIEGYQQSLTLRLALTGCLSFSFTIVSLTSYLLLLPSPSLSHSLTYSHSLVICRTHSVFTCQCSSSPSHSLSTSLTPVLSLYLSHTLSLSL